MDPKADKIIKTLNKDMDRTDPVSVQRYTRQGRLKRPGVRVMNPNSLAALDAHRARTQFNGTGLRRCRKCNRIAVRELEVCYFHGGKGFLRVMRRNNGRGPVGKTSEIASRNVRKLFAERLVPPELYRVPLFVEVGEVALPKQFGKPTPKPGEGVPQRIAARLLLREIIAAWTAAQDGDPNVWTDVVSKARAMGYGY